MGWQDDFRSAYAGAKQSNENRYQDILGGYNQRISDFGSLSSGILNDYGERYQRGTNDILGMGRSGMQDIQDSFSSQKSKIMGGVIAHGIGNSTVMQSMMGGLANDQERIKMQFSDQLARTQVGVDAQLSGDQLKYADSRLREQMSLSKDKLDFMERRKDPYPDMKTYQMLDQRPANPLAGKRRSGGAINISNNQASAGSGGFGGYAADSFGGYSGPAGGLAVFGAASGAIQRPESASGDGSFSFQRSLDLIREDMWDAQDAFRLSQDHYFIPNAKEWSGWEFGPASDFNMPFFRDNGRAGNFYDTGNEGNAELFYDPAYGPLDNGWGSGGGSWDDYADYAESNYGEGDQGGGGGGSWGSDANSGYGEGGGSWGGDDTAYGPWSSLPTDNFTGGTGVDYLTSGATQMDYFAVYPSAALSSAAGFTAAAEIGALAAIGGALGAIAAL